MQDLLTEMATAKVRRELRHQIQDSIKEERTAVEDYRRRARYARRGYPAVAQMYDHIAEEEQHHIKELLDMLGKIHE